MNTATQLPQSVEAPVGRYLVEFREEAGLTQAQVAKGMTVSSAVVSRMESDQRPASDEEVSGFLEAIGTARAREFLEYRREEWLELERPAFDHPNRSLLRKAEMALREIRKLRENPELKHSFEVQLTRYEEDLRRLADYVRTPNYSIASVGSIGVGKTTKIGKVADLEVVLEPGGEPQPVLEVGAGGITICEIHIKQGPAWGLLVEPRSVEEVKADVEELCDFLRQKAAPAGDGGEQSEGESLAISKEVVRAIRNMAGLTDKKTKEPDGRTIRIDPAKELAQSINDPKDLVVQVLARMELARRDRRDIWYSPDSGKQPLIWLRDVFMSINNGRHSEFSLPRRIEVVVPRPVMGDTFLNVRIIDTKGIDQTAARSDLEQQLDDPYTVVVLCSRFLDAPEASLQRLLERARNAGVRDLAAKVSVLVLPRFKEALAVKEDDGTAVSNAAEGYELKREQVDLRLQQIRLPNLAVGFFNSMEDSAAQLRAFLAGRIDALRSVYIRHLSEAISAVTDLVENYENKQKQAVIRDAAKRLMTYLANSGNLVVTGEHVYDALIQEMRSAHASTVRATIRREGRWPNLEYYHHLGHGARRIAAGIALKRMEQFKVIGDNLLQDAEFADAHEFVRQTTRQFEEAVDALLKKVYLVGHTAFTEELHADQSFWARCMNESGRGYRSRVVDHNKGWFSAVDRENLERFVSQMISNEWGAIVATLRTLINARATGNEA